MFKKKKYSTQDSILLNNQQNFELSKKEQRRIDTAKYLLASLSKGSAWLRVENLKLLYFFLDYDFVKKGLVETYKTTDKKELKNAIKELHDGTLDVSNLLEYKERLDELNKAEEEFRQEMLKVKYQNELEEDKIIKEDFKLMKFKSIINK